jgi:hypothetical protein
LNFFSWKKIFLDSLIKHPLHPTLTFKCFFRGLDFYRNHEAIGSPATTFLAIACAIRLFRASFNTNYARGQTIIFPSDSSMS